MTESCFPREFLERFRWDASVSSPPLLSSSSSVYLSLKEEEDGGEATEGKEMESGPDEVMTETYMTMAQSENCRLVDASIQKNISFDGKPMTPTGWNGGVGEIFSLRDQLKQAEEKASQVQREVGCGESFIRLN